MAATKAFKSKHRKTHKGIKIKNGIPVKVH